MRYLKETNMKYILLLLLAACSPLEPASTIQPTGTMPAPYGAVLRCAEHPEVPECQRP